MAGGLLFALTILFGPHGVFSEEGALIDRVAADESREEAIELERHEGSLTLEELTRLSDAELAKVDIAAMNLAVAEGLPGSEHIDRATLLGKLDEWARRVAVLTDQKRPQFARYPDYYQNSRAKYCSVILVLTLQNEFGLHYNIPQRTAPTLAKSQDQFIHGILTGTGGTCASLPVAIVAVGRRLGYPLKLVQGFSHFYVRWDDPETGEQFNIEASTAGGMDFRGDESYREKAREMGFPPLEGGNYLQSMSPREELSSFLTTRGDCLRENGRTMQALEMYREAVRLAPENAFAQGLLRTTVRVVRKMREAQAEEASYRRHERLMRRDPRGMFPGMPSVSRPQAVRIGGAGGVGGAGLEGHVGGIAGATFSGSADAAGAWGRLTEQARVGGGGNGFSPPGMGDSLREQQRRNEELRRWWEQDRSFRERERSDRAARMRDGDKSKEVGAETGKGVNGAGKDELEAGSEEQRVVESSQETQRSGGNQ